MLQLKKKVLFLILFMSLWCFTVVDASSQCGLSNKSYFLKPPQNDLCSSGVSSSLTASNPWKWTCDDSTSQTSTSCMACSYAFSDWEKTKRKEISSSVIVYGKDFYMNVYNRNYMSASSDTVVKTSFDGKNWTEVGSIPFDDCALAYGNGLFVVVGGGGEIATSIDGKIWTQHESLGAYQNSFATDWGPLLYANGVFVTISNAHKTRYSLVATSINGIDWEVKYHAKMNSTSNYKYFSSSGITYGNGLFVAVGDYGYVSMSVNGKEWSVPVQTKGISTEEYYGFSSIAYGNGLFVAIISFARENKIYTSRDGLNWVKVNNEVTTQKFSVSNIVYGNGIFIASNKDIIASRDLIKWDLLYYTCDDSPFVVGYAHCKFFAVPKKAGDVVRILNACEEGGTCGLANNQKFSQAPTKDLCSSGQSSTIKETATGWTWSCIKDECGVNESCSAIKISDIVSDCGLLHNKEVLINSLTNVSDGLCITGSVVNFQVYNGRYYWRCASESRTSNWCYANIFLTKDGVCGLSNGKSFINKPTVGLCNSGKSTEVTGDNASWRWQCKGRVDGRDVDCSAKRVILGKGVCGGVNNTEVAKNSLNNKSSGLCSAGSVVNFQVYNGRYYWRCADLQKIAGTVSVWCYANIR